MKLASLLIAVTLSATVLVAASATVKEPGSAPIPENHGRRLGAGVVMEKTGLEREEERQRGMVGEGRNGEDEGMIPFEEGKFAGRNYKICLIPGPCYKKKLVCPKQCSSGGGLARIQPDHFPSSSCVLDCNKCTARC